MARQRKTFSYPGRLKKSVSTGAPRKATEANTTVMPVVAVNATCTRWVMPVSCS